MKSLQRQINIVAIFLVENFVKYFNMDAGSFGEFLNYGLSLLELSFRI